MIDHLFIKNYKAFKKENIPLDKNTLLIGTNASGKTTVLEALDLFFNNVFNYDFIVDKEKDVIIEIHVNDERYRKVYSPPSYVINYNDCIGDMFQINHVKYIYVPSRINPKKLLNDILTVNMLKAQTEKELTRTSLVFDYLDGKLGNNHYNLFKVDTRYEMNINDDISFTKNEYTDLIQGITYPTLILGIDNVEQNFVLDELKHHTEFIYQTILSTNNKKTIKNYDYFVHPLYKGNIEDDYEAIKPRIEGKKKYLLVEGKYDVPWFEKALKLLGKYDEYRVIPCGGYGNIQYVKKQLDKEGIQSIVITDGDTPIDNQLSKEIIELYADLDYVNKRFSTYFEKMPTTKREFFKNIAVKDGVVKEVLSSWAKKNLRIDSEFVTELNTLI